MIGGSYQPIWLIFTSKQRNTTFYLVCIFEENRSKIATVGVPNRQKKYKMAAMTSSKQIESLKKKSLIDFEKTF